MQNTERVNTIMYCGWSFSSNDEKDMSCADLNSVTVWCHHDAEWVSTMHNSRIPTAVPNNLIQMWLQTTKINAVNQI